MKRNRFAAQMGVLLVVLVVALGLMGVGYAKWSDAVDISATATSGIGNDTLMMTGRDGHLEEEARYWVSNTSRVLLPDPDRIVIHIANAVSGASYYCDFSIQNGGTIPTQIQSISIFPSPSNEFAVNVSGVAKGDVIDPGQSVAGTVSISVSDQGKGLDYDAWVTFVTVFWNQ